MSVAPDRPKGPPLNAMRAFEAAARLQSFVLAAEELSVTPGAISQHIKSLEAWAGGKLFERNAKGVELTRTAKTILPAFVSAFDAIGAATHVLRNAQETRTIHIAALPSIAQLWLPSKLALVRREFPDLVISVTALETPPNLNRELFDLSVFIGEIVDPDSQIELERDVILPVCDQRTGARLNSVSDLKSERLLHDASWSQDWNDWFKSAGSDQRSDPKDPTYSLYSLALEEAKAGAGVLMGHMCLVRDALRSGMITAPFKHEHCTEKSLVLSRTSSKTENKVVANVSEILISGDLNS